MPSAAAKPAILPVEFVLPEFTLPDVLPTNVAALTALLHAAARSHEELKRKAQFHVQHLLEQFMLARHRLFGASSEQYAGQASLFGERRASRQLSQKLIKQLYVGPVSMAG